MWYQIDPTLLAADGTIQLPKSRPDVCTSRCQISATSQVVVVPANLPSDSSQRFFPAILPSDSKPTQDDEGTLTYSLTKSEDRYS